MNGFVEDAELRQFIPPPLFQWADFAHESRREAAALFIDVAGFTNLSERLMSHGAEGAEILDRTIALYFDSLLDIIDQYFGLPIKISGDALTILFLNDSNPLYSKDSKDSHIRAIGCAQALQFAGHQHSAVDLHGRRFLLQHKIGLGSGQLFTGEVGDPKLRVEYIFGGKALDDAVEAEHRACPGEVWAAPSVVSALKEPSWWAEADSCGYCRLAFPAPSALRDFEPHCPARYIRDIDESAVLERFRALIPKTVREHAEHQPLSYLCRHQNLAVLFAGCPGLTLSDQKSFQKFACHYRQMQQIVEQYGGFLSEFEAGDKGSKLIVLFGAPTTLEDPGGQASRCALAMQLAAKERGIIPDQRIGLTSGRLYVGRIGCRSLVKYSALGDRMNVAARLMTKATSWEVLADRQAVRLADASVRWGPPRGLYLKGKEEEVTVRSLIIAPPVRRDEKRGKGLLGRSREMSRINGLLDALTAGKGALVQLTGPAGIGKTRMLETIRRSALARGINNIQLWAGNLGRRVGPHCVLRPLILDLIGSHPQATEQEIKSAFEMWRSKLPDELREHSIWLAPLLEIPWEIDPTLATLPPEDQLALRQSAIIDSLRFGYGQSTPRVLLIDDGEAMDEPSVQLLQDLFPMLASTAIVIVLASRGFSTAGNDVRNSLASLPVTLQIQLKRLEPAAAAKLAARRLKAQTLGPELIDLLQQKAQGNPLLIESWLDVLTNKNQIRLIDNIACLANFESPATLPDRLEAIILTQLGRLSLEAQLTVRVATVIGQSFDPRDVAALHPEGSSLDEVNEHLRLAADADLLRYDRDNAPTMFFNRPEAKEAIHDSLPFHLRRTLHARRARQIRMSNGTELSDDLKLRLAEHYDYIESPEGQIKHFKQAHDICRKRFDYRGAVHWSQKLVDLQRESAKPEELLKTLEQTVSNWASLGENEERRKYIRQWISEADRLKERGSQALAHAADARARLQTGDSAQALVSFEKALELARELNIQSLMVEILMCGASVFGESGNTPKALALAREALAFTEGASPAQLFKIHFNHGFALSQMGRTRQAYDAYLKADTYADKTGDLNDKALVLGNIAVILWALGQPEEGHSKLLETLAIKRKLGNHREIGLGLTNVGFSYCQLGDLQQARLHTEEALRLFKRVGYFRAELLATSNLGEILILTGDLREATRCFQRAEAMLEQHSHEPLKIELLNRKGELALTFQDWLEAQSCFEAALEGASRLGLIGQKASALEGLAMVKSYVGDTAAAHQLIDQALLSLSSDPSAVPYPCRLWWRAHKIATANEDAGTARKYGEMAVKLMDSYQNRLASAAARKRHCGATPWNQEICRHRQSLKANRSKKKDKRVKALS